MNVTITGAVGRLGTVATRALVDAGFSVLATDKRRSEDFPAREGIAKRLGAFVTGALVDAGFIARATGGSRAKDSPVPVKIADLLDPEACYGLVEGADALVHLGNHSWMIPSISPQRLFCENATMNMNIFQAARESGVKKIVFASSVQVISGGNRHDEPASPIFPYLPLDGDVPPNPGNPYGLSKQAAEMMLAHFARYGKMECVAVRLPYLSDPAWSEYSKGRDAMPGEGFAFLDTTDAAALIVSCLNASLPGFRIYFPAAAGNCLGKPAVEVIREHYANVPLVRPLEQIETLVDTSRIQAETGWKPENNDLF